MDEKTIEKIILHFASKEVRDDFFKFFNEAKILYEIISPDAFLRPYIGDYRTLAEMNSILRNAFDPPTMYDKELVRKTESLVRENVSSTYIDTSLPIYEINGELIDKVKAKFTSDTVRIINLIKIIGQWVKDKKDNQPYLIEIGMRAERIKEMFDNRQAATQKALAELEMLINETLQAETMRKEKNMDIRSFTIYWALKEEGYIESEGVAQEIARQFEEKKDWDANSETLRELKTVIYKTLMKTPLKDRMIDIAERLLRLQKEMGRKVET
jgi:type I restriction enzyme R subunit